jgi:hypothetical protein
VLLNNSLMATAPARGEAERHFRAEHPCRSPEELVEAYRHLLPTGALDGGHDWPVHTDTVHVVVAVAARRHLARHLAFVDVSGAARPLRRPARVGAAAAAAVGDQRAVRPQRHDVQRDVGCDVLVLVW